MISLIPHNWQLYETKLFFNSANYVNEFYASQFFRRKTRLANVLTRNMSRIHLSLVDICMKPSFLVSFHCSWPHSMTLLFVAWYHRIFAIVCSLCCIPYSFFGCIVCHSIYTSYIVGFYQFLFNSFILISITTFSLDSVSYFL